MANIFQIYLKELIFCHAGNLSNNMEGSDCSYFIISYSNCLISALTQSNVILCKIFMYNFFAKQV